MHISFAVIFKCDHNIEILLCVFVDVILITSHL